jgi:hypothetical protein
MSSRENRREPKKFEFNGSGPIPRSKMAIFLSHGHKSPVSLFRTDDYRTPYAVEVAGGGRSSAMRRKMSAKRFFGIATSAIWNAT